MFLSAFLFYLRESVKIHLLFSKISAKRVGEGEGPPPLSPNICQKVGVFRKKAKKYFFNDFRKGRGGGREPNKVGAVASFRKQFILELI